jgi:hypothetical protein
MLQFEGGLRGQHRFSQSEIHWLIDRLVWNPEDAHASGPTTTAAWTGLTHCGAVQSCHGKYEAKHPARNLRLRWMTRGGPDSFVRGGGGTVNGPALGERTYLQAWPA